MVDVLKDVSALMDKFYQITHALIKLNVKVSCFPFYRNRVLYSTFCCVAR